MLPVYLIPQRAIVPRATDPNLIKSNNTRKNSSHSFEVFDGRKKNSLGKKRNTFNYTSWFIACVCVLIGAAADSNARTGNSQKQKKCAKQSHMETGNGDSLDAAAINLNSLPMQSTTVSSSPGISTAIRVMIKTTIKLRLIWKSFMKQYHLYIDTKTRAIRDTSMQH